MSEKFCWERGFTANWSTQNHLQCDKNWFNSLNAKTVFHTVKLQFLFLCMKNTWFQILILLIIWLIVSHKLISGSLVFRRIVVVFSLFSFTSFLTGVSPSRSRKCRGAKYLSFLIFINTPWKIWSVADFTGWPYHSTTYLDLQWSSLSTRGKS